MSHGDKHGALLIDMAHSKLAMFVINWLSSDTPVRVDYGNPVMYGSDSMHYKLLPTLPRSDA